MDTTFVKEVPIISFCFHPDKPYIYYLYYNNSLKSLAINEEDLISTSLLHIYDVPKDDSGNSETYGYHMTFYKKKNFLMLSYPSSFLSLWDTTNHTNLLKTSTRGKDLYVITAMAFSEHNPILFFTASNKRNLYAINISDVVSNGNLNYKKMRVPKKISINDIRCHPFDTKVLVACSDGHIRMWDQISFHNLISLCDPAAAPVSKKNNPQIQLPAMTCLSFSSDGQKLLSSDESGRIFCWDARNLGHRSVLLAMAKISELGVISIGWLNYHGEQKSHRLLCYCGEGNIQMISLKVSMHYTTQNKTSSSSGKFYDRENLYHLKNEIHMTNLKNYNLGLAKYLQIHQNNNFFSFANLKIKVLNNPSSSTSSKIHFATSLKILTFFDKLYPTLEYPVFSSPYAYRLEDYLPNKESNILLQKYIFFLDEMEIKSFRLSDGSLKNLINLKSLISSEDTKFYQLDCRPLKLDYYENGQLLLIYQMDQSFRAMLIPINLESPPKDLEIFKEYPCSFAFFLGSSSLSNPPLFLLSEDRLSYSLFINYELAIDPEIADFLKLSHPPKGNLNIKIQKVFATSLRQSFVVIYQIFNENLLRFSNNKLESNNILDFGILTSQYSFRIDYEDTILDIIWAPTNTRYFTKNLGAVICSNKVFFIDQDLKILETIKISNSFQGINPIIQASFVGPALVLCNKTNVMYTTLNKKVVPMLSFENVNYKNSVMLCMMDRVIIASKKKFDFNPKHKNKQQNLEIKCRKFNLMEILIVGYLSMKKVVKDLVIDPIYIKTLLSYFESNQISPILLAELNKNNLYNASWFLLKNDSIPQFTYRDRLPILLKMRDYQHYFHHLFEGAYSEDSTVSRKELIYALKVNPKYAHILSLLESNLPFFLNQGHYKLAIRILELLRNDHFLIKLLYLFVPHDKFLEFFSEYLNSKSFENLLPENKYLLSAFFSEISNIPSKSVDLDSFKVTSVPVFDSFKLTPLLSSFNETPIDNKEELFKEFFLKEWSILNSKPNQSLKDFKHVEVAFGEQCFHQVYYDLPGVINKIDTLATENLDQFLGYNALIPEGNTAPKKEKANDDPFDQNFNQEEEKDQFASLQIYWRFDEGKGTTINDLSDFEINGVLEFDGERDNDEVWIMLDDGDPLELEDKWGKKCPTQYGIDLNAACIKNVKKNWFSDQMTQFTIEFWLKPRTPNGVILEIHEENFVVMLQDGFPKLVVKGKPLVLMEDEGNKEENPNNEEDFQQGKNNEDSKKIKQSFWNHLAIVYDSSQQKTVILYLNCFEIGFSNAAFDPDLFKDQTVNIGHRKFNGEITEFRLWKSATSLSEIKDAYRSPLEIVAEKKKKIKMKFKEKDKNANTENAGKDLKKFAAFLTMAPPGVVPKEPLTDRKPEKTLFREEEIKKSVEKPKNEDDLGSFATYTFNVKSQNQFFGPDSENTFPKQPTEKKVASFEKISEFNEEQKWESAFATAKPQDLKKNQDFGGFGEFSSTKPSDSFPQKNNEWQAFEFGTNSVTSKPEEFDSFSGKKISGTGPMNFEPQNSNSDRMRTASLFEKYDRLPYERPKTDLNPDFGKVENIENAEAVFENPFLKKKPSPETQNESQGFGDFNEKGKFENSGRFEKSSPPSFEKPSPNVINKANFEKPPAFVHPEKPPALAEDKSKVSQEKPMVYNFDSMMNEVSAVMEKSRGFIKEENMHNAIIEIQRVFTNIKTLLQNEKDKEKVGKVQKFACYVAVYRFLCQLLIGITDMRKMKDFRKEAFLYLIIVNLNLKSDDRVNFIVKAIEKNIETKNFLIAEGLFLGLKPNLDKIRLTPEQNQIISSAQKSIANSNKMNETLLKMLCPYCKKSFHYKANKKCPKCQQSFLLCSQTLLSLKTEEALICDLCQSIFSQTVKKDLDLCIICRIGSLKKNG